MSKVFSGSDVAGKNFSGVDLSNCCFEDCDLTNTVFNQANLRGATFNRCKSDEEGFTAFSMADLSYSCFHGCQLAYSDFNDANLTGTKMRNTDINGASARHSHWDESRLDDVNFAMVDFDLASFRNVKVLRVKFKPALVTGTRHFLRLLKQKRTRKHTIFTAGTELSPFIEYCSREYRLSLLLLEIEQLSLFKKIPRIVFAALIGMVSDFGHSLSRWLISALIMVSAFAGYFRYSVKQPFESYGEAWHHALLHFINLGQFGGASDGVMQTSLNVLGYFMLGMLISIITNRFVSRW